MSEPASRLAGLLEEAARRLDEAGVAADPRREVRSMWSGISGMPEARILAGSAPPPDSAAAERLAEWVARRVRGEPLAYIRGWQEFHGLRLKVDRRVLVPRADSEAVVEAALACTPPELVGWVADLGTGSGCLLLAVLQERPGLRGLGVDASPGCLAVARENGRHSGLGARILWLAASWLDACASGLHLVLANPPYVVPGEELGAGVAEFEPRSALFTPPGDPLHAYRQVLRGATSLLVPGGALVLEVGAGRADEVEAACVGAGLKAAGRWRDLGGIERAVAARRPR